MAIRSLAIFLAHNLVFLILVEDYVSAGSGAGEKPTRSYGVVIDAGSSGSRVRLYEWTKRESATSLPEFEETFSKKQEPGISYFKGDKLDGLRPYLKEFVDAVKEKIPTEHHHDTSIYLMATAGMRLLLEPHANSIMEKIQEVLADPDLSPFQFDELQARILSGEEEGVFAWIAANYLNQYFNNPDEKESAGILELGGASTQIAFVPEGSILADKFPVRLAGRTYPLYVHSYLYYGQNFADLWIKEYLLREEGPGDNKTMMNPCMLEGDSSVEVISNINITFNGSGEPLECLELVNLLVYKVPPYQCHPKPCAIGPVYQPSITSGKQFFALSAFTFPLRTIDVLAEDGSFSADEAYHAAIKYCEKDINVIINETGRKPDFLSVECLMGLYIPVLFTKAYGFANDSRQVAARFKINGGNAEWPLGAIIYETERKGPPPCPEPRTESMLSLGTSSSSFMNRIILLIPLVLCLRISQERIEYMMNI